VEKKSNANALAGLEGLRLVSSVAIVLSHFLPYAIRAEPFGGRLGIFVDLFFVISGIVIASAYADRVRTPGEYGLFMQRRLARLYPLHAATMLVYMAIAAMMALGAIRVVNPDRYDPAQLLPYFLMVHAWGLWGTVAWNGVSWSISAELFVYLLFPVLAKAIRRPPATGLAVVAGTTVACAVVSELTLGREFPRLVTQLAPLRALPGFLLGLWLALNRDWLTARLGESAVRWMFHAGTLALAAGLVLAWPPYALLAAVWLLVTGAYLLDLHRGASWASWAPLSRQGQLTYSIYLVHPVVATTWLAFLGPRLLGTGFVANWSTLAIGLAAVFAGSAASYRWFEEPLRRRLGRPLFRVRDARPGPLN
jgi:peptidoglycan/LPS O-acetylase OafA/YrhL